MKKIILAFVVLFSSLQSFFQASDLGAWYSYMGTYDVAPRWNVQANTQFRFHNILGDWDQFLLRTGANYKLDKAGKYQAGIGFDFWHNEYYIGNKGQNLLLQQNQPARIIAAGLTIFINQPFQIT